MDSQENQIMIETASTLSDLKQILELQALNHTSVVSGDARKANGFVTVRHDLDLLEKMNAAAKQVICKSNGEVVGYSLVMLKQFQSMIPVLVPLFNMLNQLTYQDRPVNTFSYYVMGQICVAETDRGKGLVDLMYHHHRKLYAPEFDCCITSVSTSNPRSMRAHERVGFKTIHTFHDQTDEWNVLLWDWV